MFFRPSFTIALFQTLLATKFLAFAPIASAAEWPLAQRDEPRPAVVRIGGALEGSPAWAAYKRRFVEADGRVADTGNLGTSHSEGQGYGLLLAAAAADRETFDRIWSWTNSRLLIRSDRLAATRRTATS